MHDEGEEYAKQLRAAAVPVEYVEFPGMIHGFFINLGLIDDAERAHKNISQFLQRVWA